MYKILNIETGTYMYESTYWRQDNRWAIKTVKSVVQTDYFFMTDIQNPEWQSPKVFQTTRLHYAKLILNNYVKAWCYRESRIYRKSFLTYYEIVRC